MYSPNQIVYDKDTQSPTYAYHTKHQTHFMWTKKAIKHYPKIRHAWCMVTRNPDGSEKRSKTQYSLFNAIATPEHITEAKLLLKKGYIVPSTLMTKNEKDFVESYATRERIIYDFKKSLPTKWTLNKYKYKIKRFIYAFVLRKQHPSFF